MKTLGPTNMLELFFLKLASSWLKLTGACKAEVTGGYSYGLGLGFRV